MGQKKGSAGHYPESAVKITAPFYVLRCGCGLRIWSVLGELTPCPKCGRIMRKETLEGGSRGGL